MAVVWLVVVRQLNIRVGHYPRWYSHPRGSCPGGSHPRGIVVQGVVIRGVVVWVVVVQQVNVWVVITLGSSNPRGSCPGRSSTGWYLP